MDFTQYLKPELVVLLPILCFLRGYLKKRYPCRKKELEAFFMCFALIISVGYVLSTSVIESSQDFFKCVWLGVSQGIVIFTVCSYLNREPRNEKRECKRNIAKKPRIPRG